MINFQDNFKNLFDVEAMQDNFKNLFDVEAMQSNFNKSYDYTAIQESFKKFYDVEAIQENFKNLYNVEQFQGNLDQLVDAEAVKEYMESLVDQELIQNNAKLAANLVATNVNALTDAVILQSVQVRESVEDALKQADALTGTKDLETAIEAQKKFAEAQQEVALENFWNKAGLVAGLVENNVNIVKEAFEKAQVANSTTAKPAPKTATKAA